MKKETLNGASTPRKKVGKKSRTQCVAEMIRKWELEFIGLQETKTKDFPIGSVFSWEEAIMLEVASFHRECWGDFNGIR
jgi:hypothetical protein